MEIGEDAADQHGERAVSASTAPDRVSRTMASGNASSHVVTLNRGTAMAFDASSHRFVNSSAVAPASRVANGAVPAAAPAMRVAGNPARSVAAPASARNFSMASRSVAPPAAPRTNASFARLGGASSGGASSARGAGAGSGAGASMASASASHGSSASSGGSSSGGARAH